MQYQYQLSALTAPQLSRLSNVSIAKQGEINTKTGYDMDLIKIYNAVYAASDGFKETDADAEEADALMYRFLTQNNFFVSTSTIKKASIHDDKPTLSQIAAASPNIIIATIPKADASSVSTPPKSQKETLETKIRGFQTALKYAKTDEAKATLETKIRGFQTALKYAK